MVGNKRAKQKDRQTSMDPGHTGRHVYTTVSMPSLKVRPLPPGTGTACWLLSEDGLGESPGATRCNGILRLPSSPRGAPTGRQTNVVVSFWFPSISLSSCTSHPMGEGRLSFSQGGRCGEPGRKPCSERQQLLYSWSAPSHG